MKILHIITSLRTGGAERLLVDLLLFDGTRTVLYDELQARGIRIYALGCGYRSMRSPYADVVSRCQTRASLYGIDRMANDYAGVYESVMG